MHQHILAGWLPVEKQLEIAPLVHREWLEANPLKKKGFFDHLKLPYVASIKDSQSGVK